MVVAKGQGDAAVQQAVQVCFLLARGVETADIATLLGISQTTLKDHTQAIYRKLGIRKRKGLRRLVLLEWP